MRLRVTDDRRAYRLKKFHFLDTIGDDDYFRSIFDLFSMMPPSLLQPPLLAALHFVMKCFYMLPPYDVSQPLLRRRSRALYRRSGAEKGYSMMMMVITAY